MKFHDGTPFTANDVKATIEFNCDPSQAGSFLFPNPFTAEVVDKLTMRIDTGAPYPALLAYGGPVISAEHVIKAGKLDEKSVGTGRVSYEGEQAGVRLTANEDYWGGQPHIKDFIFRFVGDSQTRLADRDMNLHTTPIPRGVPTGCDVTKRDSVPLAHPSAAELPDHLSSSVPRAFEA